MAPRDFDPLWKPKMGEGSDIQRYSKLGKYSLLCLVWYVLLPVSLASTGGFMFSTMCNKVRNINRNTGILQPPADMGSVGRSTGVKR